MKPVMQTTFGYPLGNCFAACVASILELPIEAMPVLDGKERYATIWNKWLTEHGMAMVDIPAGTGGFIPGYCIASGLSPRGGLTSTGRPVLHSVVCKDMEIVHDPHPDQTFLDGSVKEYTVLIPLDPKQLLPLSYQLPERQPAVWTLEATSVWAWGDWKIYKEMEGYYLIVSSGVQYGPFDTFGKVQQHAEDVRGD